MLKLASNNFACISILFKIFDTTCHNTVEVNSSQSFLIGFELYFKKISLAALSGRRLLRLLNINFSKIVEIRNIAVAVHAILQIRPKTEIRLHFGRSRIWAGFVKMAGFRPEPKSGTALLIFFLFIKGRM